jgi:branched-subunit amino acid aminotransferase/4-amino-4-deoxychorismate lyase
LLSNSIYFYSGQWLSVADAAHPPALPLTDWGVLQGVIAVERLRTYAGQLHGAELHLARLRNTLRELSISTAEAKVSFEAVLDQLMVKNRVLQRFQQGAGDVSVVLLVTPGSSEKTHHPSEPTVIATIGSLPWSRIARLWHQGERLVVSDVQQVAPECWPRSVKVRSRLNYFLADQAAERIDSFSEALLTDRDGSITESSTGNLILIRDRDRLLTVAPAETILPGVTLARLLELAELQGWQIERRKIYPNDLYTAQEAMMTGTTAGIWSVVKADQHVLSQGVPGPAVRSFQALWTQTFGLDLGLQAAQHARLADSPSG